MHKDGSVFNDMPSDGRHRNCLIGTLPVHRAPFWQGKEKCKYCHQNLLRLRHGHCTFLGKNGRYSLCA